MSRLQEKYSTEVIPKICESFGIKNKMAAPKLSKICLNIGMGQAKNEAKRFESAQTVLSKITGQKPVVIKARMSVSNFKLREGDAVGCRVTLRGERMYDFLDRFMSLAMPRIRDFNGYSRKSFDKAGNFSLGVTEQSIFPELSISDVDQEFGMDVTLVFENSNAEKSLATMEAIGFPFRKK